MDPCNFEMMSYSPTGGYIVTEQAKSILKGTPNVLLIIVTGLSRSGKSTRINQLITGNTSTWNLVWPMVTAQGDRTVTKAFITYGPVPLSRINANFGVILSNIAAGDPNIFFIDSEGTGHLEHQGRDIFMGIMALLPVACVCINVSNGIVHQPDMVQIIGQFQLNHLLSVLPYGINLARGFVLMCRGVGYQVEEGGDINASRIEQDNRQKQILKDQLIRNGVNENADHIIVLTQPSDNTPQFADMQKNSLKDCAEFVNRIVGQRTPVSGSTVLGMIENLLLHVQEFKQNGINDIVVTQAFDHVVEHLLRQAGDAALAFCGTCAATIQRMTLDQLVPGGAPAEIDRIVGTVNQSFIDALGPARTEIQQFKGEVYEQKRTEVVAAAHLQIQQAIDGRAVSLHGEIIGLIRDCQTTVQDEYTTAVQNNVTAMTYPQLRAFTAAAYAQNNTNANQVRQRCAQRLDWLVGRVQQAVNDAANSAQQGATACAQTGFVRGLNGRVLYPHTLAEAQGEFQNQTVGANITLYTQNNMPYPAIVGENGVVTLPGLYSATSAVWSQNGGVKETWVRQSPIVFDSVNCTVTPDARTYRKEYFTGGCKGRNYHNVETHNETVIIPAGWNFGNIVWGGYQQIVGQTVTFSAPNGFDAPIPPISIRR